MIFIEDLMSLPIGNHSLHGVDVCVEEDCINVAFTQPSLSKSASVGINTLVEIDLPQFKSSSVYSDDELIKVAASYADYEKSERVPRAVSNLVFSGKQLPDLISLRKLYAFSGIAEPQAMRLKFSQWGGHGPMIDYGLSGSGVGGRYNANPNEFFPMNVAFDALMETNRSLPPQWEKSMEHSLSSQHRTKEEDDVEYNLDRESRIKRDRMLQLRRILQERKKRKEREDRYSPEYIRTEDDEAFNEAAHIPAEERLDHKREIKDDQYQAGRLEERVPGWYTRLKRIRVKEAQTVGTSPVPRPFDEEDRPYTPNRRNRDHGQKEWAGNSAGQPMFSGGYTQDGVNALTSILEQSSTGQVSDHLDTAETDQIAESFHVPYYVPLLIDQYSKGQIPGFAEQYPQGIEQALEGYGFDVEDFEKTLNKLVDVAKSQDATQAEIIKMKRQLVNMFNNMQKGSPRRQPHDNSMGSDHRRNQAEHSGGPHLDPYLTRFKN